MKYLTNVSVFVCFGKLIPIKKIDHTY